MIKCFTCAEKAPKNTKELLLLYKKIYEKDKIDYYFFENKKGIISISDKKSFEKYKKQMGKKKFEYAHISEYKNA